MQASQVFAPPADRIVSSYCRSFNNTCHTIGKLIKQDRSLLTRYRGKHQMEMKERGMKKMKEKEKEKKNQKQKGIVNEKIEKNGCKQKLKQFILNQWEGNPKKDQHDFVIKNIESGNGNGGGGGCRNGSGNGCGGGNECVNNNYGKDENGNMNEDDIKNIDKTKVVELINVIRAKIYPSPSVNRTQHKRYQSAFISDLPQRPPSAFLQRQSPKLPKQLIFKKLTLENLNSSTLNHSQSVSKSQRTAPAPVPAPQSSGAPLMYLQTQKKQMQTRNSQQSLTLRPSTSCRQTPQSRFTGRIHTQQSKNRQRRIRTQSAKQIDQLGAWNTQDQFQLIVF